MSPCLVWFGRAGTLLRDEAATTCLTFFQSHAASAAKSTLPSQHMRQVSVCQMTKCKPPNKQLRVGWRFQIETNLCPSGDLEQTDQYKKYFTAN